MLNGSNWVRVYYASQPRDGLVQARPIKGETAAQHQERRRRMTADLYEQARIVLHRRGLPRQYAREVR